MPNIDTFDENDLQYIIACDSGKDGIGPFIYHHQAEDYISKVLASDCSGEHTVVPFRPPKYRAECTDCHKEFDITSLIVCFHPYNEDMQGIEVKARLCSVCYDAAVTDV